MWLALAMAPTGMPVTVVVGNPQARSRTCAAGELVAARLGDTVDVVDLADHGPELLAWGSPVVAELKARVLSSSRLVVASPTYKAAYTGLLKLSLDRFGSGELGGLTTVPLMTGGSADHALAVEVHLRPVLVEIGASCPTRGLFVFGPAVDDPTPTIDAWWEAAAPLLGRN